jgi:hypothetical protein
MRWLAWAFLVCGPLLAAPAGVALWLRAGLAALHGADFYALSGAVAVMVAEGLLLSLRGMVREVTVLASSLLWAVWLWFGMTQTGYDWRSLPSIAAPGALGRMAIILTVLVYLTLFAVAERRRRRVS